MIAKNGWFAARPSGTDEIYKIYAENFLGQEHLARIQEEAQAMPETSSEEWVDEQCCIRQSSLCTGYF